MFLKDMHSEIFSEISDEAMSIFGNQFSEKLFRQQLAFHSDIDFSEPIDFMAETISESEIKNFLIEKSTNLEGRNFILK